MVDTNSLNQDMRFKAKVLNVGGNDIPSTVSIATAAGGANVWTVTITVKDAAGNTVTGVQALDVWISEAATGIGTTADTYSTGLAASTGTILDFGGGGAAATPTGIVHCLTAASGILVLTVTATAKPADQYVCVRNPIGAGFVVSSASGTDWGA